MTCNVMYLIKPVGEKCNLACSYCFVRKRKENTSISKETLPALFENMVMLAKQSFQQDDISLLLTWHGGEPLLKSGTFYQYAFQLQRKISEKNTNISFRNQVQTNCYALSDKHLKVFQKNKVGVSVSFDGTPYLHDLHRVTKSGEKTSQVVLSNIEKLQNYGINLGILLCITNEALNYPDEIYTFMSSLKIRNFSINSAVDIDNKRSLVTIDKYGDFLVELFRIWVKDKNRFVRIKFYEYIIRNLANKHSSLCKFNSKICGNFHTIMENGDIYYCDDYGNNHLNFKLGNIYTDKKINDNKQKLKSTINNARTKCMACKWYKICGSGCPRSWNQYRKDIFCNAYKKLFPEINNWMLSLGQETVV